MNAQTRGRLLYGGVLFIVLVLTWMYGGRMLYVSLYTLILLPCLSCAMTWLLLHGLHVTQTAEKTILVKEEPGRYEIVIRNRTPLIYNHIECLFIDDHFAVEVDATPDTLFARPFMREKHDITYRVHYRGQYRLGLRALQVNDLTGLFTLKRRLHDTIALTVLPRVLDLPYFPLATNLLSQAHSNFEIRDEDYATVSDIRPYEPTDSIKRVHWKLTAKRNEWMVKNYQSNALNRISVILDTSRKPVSHEEAIATEDRIIETTLAVMRYCLRKSMPVEFIVGDNVKKEGHKLGDFDVIYNVAAGLAFDETLEHNRALSLLDKRLNESISYINVVILTSKLDEVLYERVTSANHTGHFISLVYFAAADPDDESERIFRLFLDSGVSCYRITEETNLYEVA